jgi:6-phosphogluconolactonase (cycloisomerase 2 family)
MVHKIIAMMVAFLGLTLNVSAIAGNAEALYTMTKAADGNEIVIYNRANDGQLTLAGQVATGGDRSGVQEPNQPIDDALGAGNPFIPSKNRRFLLTLNAGRDEISVLRVKKDRFS